MRILFALSVASVASVAVLAGTGCQKAFECNGLSTDLPTATTGKGFATRSDGGALNGTATWSPGPLASVDIAGLDIEIAKDVTGTDLDSLISDGAFPICIALGDAGSASQSAQLLATSPPFKSDASHTGNAALLKLDGDNLIGRFAVNLVSTDGSKTLDLTDGAFNASRKQ